MGNDDTVVAGDLVTAVSGLAEPAAIEDEVGRGEPGEAAGTGRDRHSQRGMVSAEWAVGIVAAVAIAGVLLAVVTSGQVQDALLQFLLWVIKNFISVVE
jgi:hypothetical protein